MRLFSLLFLALFLIPQPILASDVVDPIDISGSVLIYQGGRVLSIDLDGTEKEIGKFSPELNISWSAYDEIGNHIYTIVVDDPYNPKLRRYRLMSFDLSHQTEQELYSEKDRVLARLVLSPDRSKLLIYQYDLEEIDSRIQPTNPTVCVFIIATQACQTIQLPGFNNEFNWLSEYEFVTSFNGRAYLCGTETFKCKLLELSEKIYIRSVVPSPTPGQLLLTAGLDPTDGTSHFYDFDLNTQEYTEVKQLRKTPIFDTSGFSVMQDHITSLYFSTDSKYFMTEDFRLKFSVIEIATGTETTSFQGARPEWLGNSHTFVDVTVQDGRTEVYAFDVDRGIRTTLYTTDQPFHLIVP